MLFLKTTVTGIDNAIQSLQKDLFAILCDEWGITEKDYNCYGRVYRNKTDNGYIPEAFKSKGKDYIDVFTDDKVAVLSFFGVNEKQTAANTGKGLTADVHLVFYVDLTKINQLVEHRNDEECQKSVYNILDIGSYGFEIVDKVTGVENVYKEYSGKMRDALDARTQHPKHCFRFNLKCTYDPNTVIEGIDYDRNNFINN